MNREFFLLLEIITVDENIEKMFVPELYIIILVVLLKKKNFFFFEIMTETSACLRTLESSIIFFLSFGFQKICVLMHFEIGFHH